MTRKAEISEKYFWMSFPRSFYYFYSTKGNDFKNQLRTELTRLRHCKGRDCSCSIDRGGITGCGESGGGAPAGLKPTAKGNRNRISG